jgi:hypothetical protein
MRSGSEERMSAVERMGANNEYNAFRLELTASKILRSISVKGNKLNGIEILTC